MALNGCNSGLAAAALVVLLLLPIQYFVPDMHHLPELKSDQSQIRSAIRSPLPLRAVSWISLDIPPLDLFLTVTLLLVAMVTYMCDWMQRKLIERRIKKLNQYLMECVDRLRAWDARQEQLEGTIKMVQNATSEYNLLLYLLLRQHRLGPAKKPPPSHCSFEKEMDDLDLTFVTNPTIAV